MAVQKKQSVSPPSQGPLYTRTIQSQRKGNGSDKTKENVKPNTQANKMACPVQKAEQIWNTTGPRGTTGSNGPNVDERLKAARERREEHQKALASRELSRLEREQRARRYYEQQLKERKKKFLEQRFKEEARRAAVEQKRNQRLLEEKERYESVVRKTQEKSQKAQQSSLNRGRKVIKTNVPRRLPMTSWEKNLVSRLLTPTCSYLARSKSAGCETGEEVSFHSMNTTTTSPYKSQPRFGAINHRPSASQSPKNMSRRSVSVPQIKLARQQDASKNKILTSGSNIRAPAANTRQKPAPVVQSRTVSLSPERKVKSPRRSSSRHSTPLHLELSSVPEEDVTVLSHVPSSNSRPDRALAEGQQKKMGDKFPPETPRSNLPDAVPVTYISRTAGDGSSSQTSPAPQTPQIISKPPSAGTSDPGEALRLLAEKRREARLQREREEQERLQREEAERRSREELEQRRAQERARQEAEAQRLIEEKRRREEEEQRRAEEERAQAMKEAALLQKQREEEQAKERAKAEQLRQEREIIAQKEEADRQARKKRLEEIMRRTRRTDSPDTKSVSMRILPNEAQPKENTQPVHNGAIKDALKLPLPAKPSQLRLNNEEDMVPVVAFKERRSLRTLTGLEEIQSHQRAGHLNKWADIDKELCFVCETCKPLQCSHCRQAFWKSM